MFRRVRAARIAAAALLGAPAALAVLPAFAQTQSSSSSPDLVPVVIWTLVAVLLALLVTSIGYLYRRERGLNTPLPTPPIPQAAYLESEDITRDAAGNPLPAHALQHASGLHDDSTEQAKLLAERERVGH